jgi:hypothetical protein
VPPFRSVLVVVPLIVESGKSAKANVSMDVGAGCAIDE